MEQYEGTALDTIMVQPANEPPQTDPATNGPVEPLNNGNAPAANDGGAPAAPAAPTVEKFNIPGLGEFTADEIKEWKQGNLRQSDYTKKTQELAKQRTDNQNAVELFNYLKQNPHLVQAMKAAEKAPASPVQNAPTPDNMFQQNMWRDIKSLQLDLQLRDLKEKYGEVDEVALYQKASELKVDDLEFVYKALKYDASNVDKKALIEQAKAELKAELEKDKNGVGSLVTNSTPAAPQAQYTLTPEEKRVADAMGLTADEYAKWMGN